jgi:nucleoid-associated protein YgaU
MGGLFRVAAEKGKLKSKLRSLYGAPVGTTEDGKIVYEASVGYMEVLNKSGHILLEKYQYKWNGEWAIIIDGGNEGQFIVTASPKKYLNA